MSILVGVAETIQAMFKITLNKKDWTAKRFTYWKGLIELIRLNNIYGKGFKLEIVNASVSYSTY